MLLFSIVLATESLSYSQSHPYRKWDPNNLGTGYYVVDSYDAAYAPWRPTYRFVDTSYDPASWHRIAPGLNSITANTSTVYWQNIGGDSTNDTYAGPIPLGFAFNFYGNNYDSVYLSSNGYIGFGGNSRASGNDGPSFASKIVGALPDTAMPKAIAAFMMTDGELVDNGDSSKAFYRTSPSNDTFYLSLYNYYHPSGASVAGGYHNFRMDIQIVLTYRDSSITFMYRKFYGSETIDTTTYSCPETFRLGCIPNGCTQLAGVIGVQDSTQTQATAYMEEGNFTSYGPYHDLENGMAVKFKRWINICRVDSIISPLPNLEYLSTDTIVPKAVFQNVSPDTQKLYCIFMVRSVLTGKTLYWSQDSVVGLPPLQKQMIQFPPYVPKLPFSTEFAGPMIVAAIATPARDSEFITDTLHFKFNYWGWPWDDTIHENINIINTAYGFEDFMNNFSSPALLPGNIPNVFLWVNKGANVVDGDNFTYSPPPPRGLQGDPNGTELNSPVLLMDRRDAEGFYYDPCAQNMGDTIISIPIDIHNLKHASLGFSYERGGKLDYPRWYDRVAALGPERTVTSPDGKTVYRAGDSLIVEYADTSQVTNVTNWHEVWAQDGGKDFNFTRVYLPIDSTYISDHFRFRVRLNAKDDFTAGTTGNTGDDADAWYLDNFIVNNPILPEIEISYVRIAKSWSCLRVPASQATAIPIEVSVANNGGYMSQSIGIHISIYPAKSVVPVYDNIVPLYMLAGLQTVTIHALWNARLAGPGKYVISAYIDPKNYDMESANDSTYYLYDLEFDSSYVYDSGVNDVAQMPYKPKLGLSLPELPPYQDATGDSVANGSGTIAVKFTVYQTDTIRGAQIFFDSLNENNDPIRISLYSSQGNLPGDLIPGGCSSTTTMRQTPWDTFNVYLFDCGPIVLQPGDYWLGVSQLPGGRLELGGSGDRTSADWLVYNPSNANQNIFTLNYPEIDSLFAFENLTGSGRWYSFTYPADNGNPAFGDALSGTAFSLPSTSCGDTDNYFISQGTWIPMIRPYFGVKSYGKDTTSSSVTTITGLPLKYALEQNYPNPFAATTQIRYNIPVSGIATLRIYDALGREVKTLVNGYRSRQSQPYYTIWDGTGNNGARATTGIYICKLTINGNVFSRVLSLVR